MALVVSAVCGCNDSPVEVPVCSRLSAPEEDLGSHYIFVAVSLWFEPYRAYNELLRSPTRMPPLVLLFEYVKFLAIASIAFATYYAALFRYAISTFPCFGFDSQIMQGEIRQW